MARRGNRKSSALRVNPRSYSDLIRESADSTVPDTPQALGVNRQAAMEVTKADSTTVDWQGEYAYVLRDVRWLLGVSAVLFVGIVVASFLM